MILRASAWRKRAAGEWSIFSNDSIVSSTSSKSNDDGEAHDDNFTGEQLPPRASQASEWPHRPAGQSLTWRTFGCSLS